MRYLVGNKKWLASVRACYPLRTLATSTEDDRYIQHSKLPTMYFQPGLFRLPIPKLEDTCARYMAALQPVVSSEEAYAATQRLMEDFKRVGGVGRELQTKLIVNEKNNKHSSYISQPWFDMYLADRQSLVLNYNPFIVFKEDSSTDQALRAANLIWSAVRFRATLMEEKLEPEVFHLNPQKSNTPTYWNIMKLLPRSLSCYGSALFKAFPLDMSQYYRLFNTTRIPAPAMDQLATYDETCSHVVVMRNGHIYSLQAAQQDGRPVPCEVLYHQLQGILADETPPPSHPLGYLTCQERDKWAELRGDVELHNEEELAAIDSALLVLCLDDSEPTTAESLSHCMLHNYGANRWFDKSIQLIVTKGGHAAINFEHAWGDGVAVLRLLEELYKDKKHSFSEHAPTLDGVLRLKFNPTPQVTSAIEEAKKEVETRCQSLSVDVLQYQKFGRNLIKKLKLSPDAVLQLAIQIAYYRQFKGCVPTYESCSTAAFKHGRTETIRPASAFTKQCAEAFEHGHSAGPEEILALITEASNHHSKLVKEAAMGQGFDRHLFVMKVLAEKEGIEVPLFQDPNYSYMNEIILSTSTLSSDAVLLGGFAPVSPRGYGVGYGIMDDWLGLQVTTYPTCDGKQMVDSAQQVFDDLFDIFNGENFKNK